MAHGSATILPVRTRLTADLATLGRIVARRGVAAALAHCRETALLRLHDRLVDRRRLAWEAASSRGYARVTHDQVVGRSAAHGFDYAPTPCLVLDWILDALPVEPAATTLVDVGSGRGRVVLQAAARPFRAVIGIEHARPLHEAALANLAALPADRRACGDIAFRLGDAADLEVPSGAVLMFFFNPFDAALLGRLLARIAAAAAARREPLSCVFGAIKGIDATARRHGFRPLPLPPAARLRLAAASPLSIAAYRA